MSGKKRRDCTKCIAYCNMLKGRDYKCGLGFHVVEDLEAGNGIWKVVVFPYEDECSSVKQPLTKEEFVKTAGTLGIEWDIRDVVSLKDIKY